MASRQRYERISKDLDRHREIPSRYRTDLEDRLAVAFKPQTSHLRQPRGPRQPLGGTSRSHEIRSRHKRKKAQIVYQYVSKNAPHTFLPFILSTSPNTCESFDPYQFSQSRETERGVPLDNSVKELFASIADRHEFTQNPEYQNLVAKIFFDISPNGSYNISVCSLQLKANYTPLLGPQPTSIFMSLSASALCTNVG